MIPVSFLFIQDLDVSALRTEAGIDRRSLKHCEACIGNLLHILSDGREVPAPNVENCLCVGSIWIVCHTVNSLCRRIGGAGHKAKARNCCKYSVHFLVIKIKSGLQTTNELFYTEIFFNEIDKTLKFVIVRSAYKDCKEVGLTL